MGKNGPCCHCGIASTPLWRNGPPEKPVLCNACGSRWRTKGSLTNYTPLHAREAVTSAEVKVTKLKCVSSKPKEQKLLKKKQNNIILENEREMQFCDQNFQKIIEGDTSNRASSGSAISYSESCAHFGAADASDLAGSAQSNDWESQLPSKKRTSVSCRGPSSVERLTKDLHSIMHEQQSSYLSGCSEGDLLYQRETPMGSFEIGYGSVLIRHPNLKLIEEESEASSFTVDNRLYITDEAYSGSASFPINCETKGTNCSNTAAQEHQKSAALVDQDNAKRNKLHRKLLILQEPDSSLMSIDLKDIVNFESFMKYFTYEEQQQLLKHLPTTDTVKPPESLRSMFSTSQFMETLYYFQKLLGEGIFSLSSPGANTEERRNLKRFVLHSSAKSKWVECYKQLKEKNYRQIKGQEIASGSFAANFNVSPLKRPCSGQNHSYTELKGTMRSPKRICKHGSTDLPSGNYSQLNSSVATSEFIDPRSFFESPPDRRFSLALLEQIDDSSDHDLLLDIPCSSSFPEAELLYHPLKQKPVANSSPAESGVADEVEGTLSSYQSSNFN